MVRSAPQFRDEAGRVGIVAEDNDPLDVRRTDNHLHLFQQGPFPKDEPGKALDSYEIAGFFRNRNAIIIDGDHAHGAFSFRSEVGGLEPKRHVNAKSNASKVNISTVPSR